MNQVQLAVSPTYKFIPSLRTAVKKVRLRVVPHAILTMPKTLDRIDVLIPEIKPESIPATTATQPELSPSYVTANEECPICLETLDILGAQSGIRFPCCGKSASVR